MSQEKAQLIAPLGNMTVPGVTATGVITATSFEGNIAGSATSIKQGSSISAGVVTASSFAGNLTGNIQRLADSAPNISVGVVTATSFSGNLTGSVTDLTSAPAITVGVVTATTLKGPVTGNITGNVSGHAGGLGVSYNGGWPGAGTSQISAGVMTATSYYGDGSNLDGVSSGPVSQQAVTIDGASTSIDLSNGNLIYASQSANTTVSFANSENGNVYFVRVKDATDTARTITWPDRINWEGGTTPTLINVNDTEEAQVFLLVTRDMGVTWYGKEIYKNVGAGFALFTWGTGGYGAGGQNDRVTRSSPIQVASNNAWGHVYQGIQGNLTNFYGKLDGSLWSAGYNSGGQMRQNDRVTRSSPTQIGTDTTWSTSAVISRFTPIIPKTDGTMWSWGRNNHGQLGLNQSDNLELSSPTQIPGTTWSSVAGLSGRVLALKTNGSLWSWGYNEYGQTGSSDRTRRSSPNQVGTDTTWAKLPVCGAEAGTGISAAIKTDGTLWVWGNAYFYGQLGLNETGASSRKSSPTQIPGTTWSNVATGGKSTMATKTDGTLWVMGTNEFGTLGQNEGPGSTSGARSSPTQIPGTTWDGTQMRIPSNGEGMKAMNTDGTLWVWGAGGGWMGLNSEVQRSSPTQVPGTWEAIGGGEAVSALKA